MNIVKVIKKLEKKYPGKNIIKNPEDNPTEILCEVDPSSNHPEYSIAIAVIDKSEPHVHKKSTETYKIVRGKLSIYVDNEKHELEQGDKYTVLPGQIHWAEGKETWIECISKPGWALEDHILKEVEN